MCTVSSGNAGLSGNGVTVGETDAEMVNAGLEAGALAGGVAVALALGCVNAHANISNVSAANNNFFISSPMR